MSNFKTRLAALLCLGQLLLVRADNALTEARSTLEKWVETRQLIARAQSDWQQDKDTLLQTIALYEREMAALSEQMAQVGTNNTQALKEFKEAESLKQVSLAARERAASVAAETERNLKSLAPRLPLPLQEGLRKELVRMPDDPSNTKMVPAERVQVCVGVLNEIDKFNSALNVYSEKRKNAKGEEVSVQTLYVGLGVAYFVNDLSDFAGIGTPGSGGWEWVNKPEIAARVADTIKIYRNEMTARFVTLPAAVR